MLPAIAIRASIRLRIAVADLRLDLGTSISATNVFFMVYYPIFLP